MLLTKGRVIHSVVDSFLFKLPGFGSLLTAFSCTPGTVASCAEGLRDGGHLLGLSPGGVYEAQFSNHYYKIMWKNRLGFAKIAIEAQVPIIPVFTQVCLSQLKATNREFISNIRTYLSFYPVTKHL